MPHLNPELLAILL